MAEVIVNDKLIFEFATEGNGKVKTGVHQPLDTLDTELVVTAGDTIIGQNVFMDADGNPITDLLSAYHEQTIREFFLGGEA